VSKHQIIAEELKEPALIHRKRYKGCRACGIRKQGIRVVLWRGEIPSDFCLIGEAPGEAENTLGYPFLGPAGKLLDEIIEEALEKGSHRGSSLSYSITNLAGCWPRDSEELSSGTTRAPTATEARACSDRLIDFLDMADPRLIVTLGSPAKKLLPSHESWLAKGVELPRLQAVVNIIHPSAILRTPSKVEAGMSFKRAVVTLSDALARLRS